jgi:hypothetical protein
MVEQCNQPGIYPAAYPVPHLAAWLADWPTVRSDIEQLLDAYLRRKPDYDRSRIVSVLEALERTLAELAYDTGWLEGKLS